MKASRTLLLAMFALGLTGPMVVSAFDAGTMHGGILATAGGQQFEVVFARSGVMVYPLAADGKPMDVSRLKGTATFYHPNAPEKPWFQRPIVAAGAPGAVPTSLNLNLDMSAVPKSGAKVAFEIVGLPTPVAMTVPFTLSAAPVPAVAPLPAANPVPAAPALSYGASTRADGPAIAAQRVCKVSGKPLGSMGGPVKVTYGNQSTFICCASCLAKIQANPAAYFAAR